MSGDDIESNWRSTVVRQIEDLTKLSQNTAVLIERVDGRITAVENAVKEMRESPSNVRSNLSTVFQAGGCLGSMLFAMLSISSMAVSIIALVLHH